MNSLSSVALARYGSDVALAPPSVETFDGHENDEPIRHIPRFLRQPTTPVSVLDEIAHALPGIDIDADAANRAAEDIYGMWRCPVAECATFIDPYQLREHERDFVLQQDIGVEATVLTFEGACRLVTNNPRGARAVLQLLSYHHYEQAHLVQRGLQMIISPAVRRQDGQVSYCVSSSSRMGCY